MKLDFNKATGAYILRVPRGEASPDALMQDHGFDFSATESTPGEAVLFTREPYAAVTFWEHATSAARSNLENIHAQIEASRAPDCDRRFACPPDKEFWPFQRASLNYSLARQHALVGDEPGLGKTPIAIGYCNEIQAKRVLVICPANIRLQWMKRIREWTTMPFGYIIHPVLKGKHGVHPNAEWTIVSYDLARTEGIGKALAKGEYDVLILDEAHQCKTVDARRTRAIFGGGAERHFDPLIERSARVLALTGTPLPNRPREAYTLARGLCFDAIDWLSEDGFTRRFNPSLRRENIDPVTGKTSIWIDERTGRHAELQNRLRANFMVRHLKREVMPQLHMPVFDLIQVEDTGPVKQALAAEKLLDIDPETLAGANAAILGQVAEVRRMMGVAIAPQAADYVEMLIDGGEDKLVLFGWHIEVLDILERMLAKHGTVRIDGRTSPKNKDANVQAFINNPNIRVIIGNIQSMGTGTDGLQLASNHALIVEPAWTPGENTQAFDRLDRGGQTRTVQGDIFVAPNSIAERVLAAALRKGQTTHKVLDNQLW